MNKYLKFLELVYIKVTLNLKSEASKSYLGYIWWILEPIFFVLIMYIVFGVFLARGGEGFVAFLVCGNIPYLWFSKSVSNSCNSIVQGRGLISQVKINKAFFPIVVIGQDLIKQSVVFAMLLVFLFAIGVQPGITWLYLIPIALVQLSFVMACSLFVAAVVPAFPDFRYLVITGLQLLMFGSGIFYSFEDVLMDEHKAIFLLNPMANIINNLRLVLLQQTSPEVLDLTIIFVCCTCVSILILIFFEKYNSMYSKLVIE